MCTLKLLAAPNFLSILGTIPARFVSLGIQGVRVVLFLIDPFLWIASLQAKKKREKK